ncbi:aldose epimerase family protein [Jannaschia pohangensis]|uniref:Aldose 1-epimerase n=1 Tax=Jannaschia pohangensis TaxID=390807 RepID=A0A1I3QJV3_9RHOB|nr:aldose epimerase family protein [Jannaschia pohangensis]SFJ33456.1 aldose 1-epimerase [Jannaschia pohangensis]
MDLNRHVISGHGLTATFTEWGAALVDLRLDGVGHPLVLGLAVLGDYAAGHSSYMGATAGRVANRIGNARFTLDGVEHRTDPNFLGRHTLHGGSAGIGKRVWDVLERGSDHIRFGIDLDDGEMGFPGAMRIEALFTCAPGACLRVEYTATCEAPTLCNIAHHSYWNLSGSADVSDHYLTVAADCYVPVDDDLIPTGVADVAGTEFDFRAGRSLPGAGLLDHNLCLSDARGPLRDVAVLHAPGLSMAIATTEPGLQVYDGAKLNTPVPGLDGRRYGPHAGVALEPQVWPDAPNHDDFPDCGLRPGETYHQITTFTFSKD